MPKSPESQAADGLALLIGMAPSGASAKKPAAGNRCIVNVPAKALEVDGQLPAEVRRSTSRSSPLYAP